MKIILVCSFLLTQLFGWAQGSYEIQGSIDGADSGFVYLHYSNNDKKFHKDSGMIKGGSFMLRGALAMPVEALCTLTSSPDWSGENSARFFIEPGKMTLKLDKHNWKATSLSGSKTELENQELARRLKDVEAMQKPVVDELTEAGKIYRAAFEAKQSQEYLDSLKEIDAAIRKRLEPFNNQVYSITAGFFMDQPRSYVTLSKLTYYVSKMPLDTLELIYSRFAPKMQATLAGRNIKSNIQELKDGSPGSVAKDFIATDINGKTLQLSKLRGQYILLDFWASWCVPCRKGNPHLKELYKRYHEKGIEFIGISDDDSKPDLWRKAVAKDDLPWRHVLRGLNWNKLRAGLPNEKDISRKFGIHTLPTKILIDRQGKIVGRYDESEEALDKKLEEIFGG